MKTSISWNALYEVWLNTSTPPPPEFMSCTGSLRSRERTPEAVPRRHQWALAPLVPPAARKTQRRKHQLLTPLRVAPPGLAAAGEGLPSCPSWARTRTLLIQRGRDNQPNSSNLLTFTRVRVTRCWNLPAFMPAFAVLYSLKCRSLPDPSSPLRLVEPPICNGECRRSRSRRGPTTTVATVRPHDHGRHRNPRRRGEAGQSAHPRCRRRR